MIRPHGCDYCHQGTPGNQDGDLLHVIELSRKLNGDKVIAEICSTCIKEIVGLVIARQGNV